MTKYSFARLKKFLEFWGIALLLWIGVAYELYILGPKLIQALMQYL
ncbi:MAG: hypothetical protein OK457_10580 [Thaumarchaeota archaeon]|nr:hypothetical protein [Nitrososphaerota archaeon]